MQSPFKEISDIRHSKDPITTTWNISGNEATGTLIWDVSGPILRIFLPGDREESISVIKRHPIIALTTPPEKVNIHGSAKGGVITLEDCVRSRHITRTNETAGTSTHEVDFLPTSVWLGTPKERLNDTVRAVQLRDPSLQGIFGHPRIQQLRSWDTEIASVFAALGKPESIWTVHGSTHLDIPLGDTGWTLSLNAAVSENFSATDGASLQAIIDVVLRSQENVMYEEALKKVLRVEELISIFSLEPFTFQHERYAAEDGQSIGLVWRLGDNERMFKPPMRHQVLIDLSDGSILRKACENWFFASKTVNLSRWLFVKSLKESDNGLARFIGVTQALEVLGREHGIKVRMEKSQLRKAVASIRDALTPHFETQFIDRVANLVGSSNRASFQEILHHMFQEASNAYQIDTNEKLKPFCKLVSDTRNDVVHMNGDDEDKLTRAFEIVNILGRELSFWYAIYQALQIDVPIRDLMTFRANNRNARYGPQSIMESL